MSEDSAQATQPQLIRLPQTLRRELEIDNIISRTQLNLDDEFIRPPPKRMHALQKYGNLGKVFILVGIVAIIVARIAIF